MKFSQEMVKICAAAWILDHAEILTGRAGTTSRYSTGETPPIKADEVYMSERQHIYEDLNESSSARPGGSRQLEDSAEPK